MMIRDPFNPRLATQDKIYKLEFDKFYDDQKKFVDFDMKQFTFLDARVLWHDTCDK